jgi:hypothetical protein
MTDTRTNIFSDRILRVFIILLTISFIMMAGPFILTSMQDKLYNSTRDSELQYTLTITSTSSLSGVTLFVPLPADAKGTSPVIEAIGTGNQDAACAGWHESIFGANNESYLKLWTDSLTCPSGTSEITCVITIVVPSPALHTRNPLRYDYTLRPIQDLIMVPCKEDPMCGHPLCFQYQSLVYASYNTSPGTNVTLQATLSGINRWSILQEYQNGYTNTLSSVLYGPVQGWFTAEGRMVTSCGDDNPYWKEQIEVKVNTSLRRGVNTSMMRWHTFTPLP